MMCYVLGFRRRRAVVRRRAHSPQPHAAFVHIFALAFVCLVVMLVLWAETGSGPVVQIFAYLSIVLSALLFLTTIFLMLTIR
jgi:protein-S-isoprenylcysteine O-methyltransferase Ste14